MIVYDVVQKVTDNKFNSYAIGEHLERVFTDEREADRFAALANDYCNDKGSVSYYVEEIDESSNERKEYVAVGANDQL